MKKTPLVAMKELAMTKSSSQNDGVLIITEFQKIKHVNNKWHTKLTDNNSYFSEHLKL